MICPCVYQLLTLIKHYGLPITPSIIFSTICKTVVLTKQCQQMVHVKSNGPSNAKKTEQLLIVTRQILQLVNQPILDLYLTGNRVDEAVTLPGTAISTDLIGKLSSIIYLPKRAKGYLSLHCRKLSHNAFVKPIFEYCCPVWGNAPNDRLAV